MTTEKITIIAVLVFISLSVLSVAYIDLDNNRKILECIQSSGNERLCKCAFTACSRSTN